MPTDETSRQPPEEFDPSQTLFFKRRKQQIHFLPLAVVCALVLGSGALLTWVVSQSGKRKAAELITKDPVDPYSGQRLLSPGEARALENPVRGTPVPAQPIAVAPVAAAAAAPAFDSSKPIRAALPVTPAPAPAPPPMAEPAAMPGAGDAALNFDLANSDNQEVRAEVLRRVDQMPGVSAANKDKLYASVDHARGMGRVLTIPFEKGESAVRNSDIERLRQQLAAPSIEKLLNDPTVVFVILGYADQKGNEKINAEISLGRARSVMDALRDKCGLQNVMHSVAMGSSTMFSTQQGEKNRVVEIWAVLP